MGYIFRLWQLQLAIAEEVVMKSIFEDLDVESIQNGDMDEEKVPEKLNTELLSCQLRIKNFVPLKSLFVDLHMGSRTSSRAFSLALERGWSESASPNARAHPARTCAQPLWVGSTKAQRGLQIHRLRVV
ncbi:coatomer subunit alpha-1-like protein [Tanacetum coccineum]